MELSFPVTPAEENSGSSSCKAFWINLSHQSTRIEARFLTGFVRFGTSLEVSCSYSVLLIHGACSVVGAHKAGRAKYESPVGDWVGYVGSCRGNVWVPNTARYFPRLPDLAPYSFLGANSSFWICCQKPHQNLVCSIRATDVTNKVDFESSRKPSIASLLSQKSALGHRLVLSSEPITFDWLTFLAEDHQFTQVVEQKWRIVEVTDLTSCQLKIAVVRDSGKLASGLSKPSKWYKWFFDRQFTKWPSECILRDLHVQQFFWKTATFALSTSVH